MERLQNNRVARITVASLFALVVSSASTTANRIANDPTTAPAAHASAAMATIAIWANWVSAILAVPLGIAALLYYAAVFYQSKLFQDSLAWWRRKRGIK